MSAWTIDLTLTPAEILHLQKAVDLYVTERRILGVSTVSAEALRITLREAIIARREVKVKRTSLVVVQRLARALTHCPAARVEERQEPKHHYVIVTDQGALLQADTLLELHDKILSLG